ncbi:MAG: hypothetical protein ABI904_03420 [Chloroflexota bacterium]
MKDVNFNKTAKILMFAGTLWWALFACGEVYNVSWGTGNWLGQFSPKWFVLFIFFLFAWVLLIVIIRFALWSPQRLEPVVKLLSSFRSKLGYVRWIFAICLLFLPIYFLQYTYWGIVLHGVYVRLLMSAFSAVLSAWLITENKNEFINWKSTLIALVITSGLYNAFVALTSVTSYPFSLGWSEGNRLWDYSILFGSRLYDYPLGQSIPVYLDIGRQFVGGIPFLVPGVNIWEVRLWIALIDVIPYLILGWVAFRVSKKNGLWILAGIWAYTFVVQGPIHPPLLICAIIVVLAWERPLWLAIPLIAVISYFAQISRFTWLFAPGIWAVMLEMGSAGLVNNQLDKKTWVRAISVGLAGIAGGFLAPFIAPVTIQKWLGSTAIESGGVTLSSVQTQVSDQPLLWYRLLPNTTYGPGILIGLLLACVPLIAILVYLARTGRWQLNGWQKISIIAPLFAFLGVGLVVSVKIGGGGDLHNMDMFIIGLMFAAVLAWQQTGWHWIEFQAMPGLVQCLLIALLIIPAYSPLKSMAPISVQADIQMVATLADITPMDPLPNPLPDTLPSTQDTSAILENIRQAVADATPTGAVLFMDQRQLLTFGYIKGVPLVPEYDKKVLIDKALSSDAKYFDSFYRDLADHRFSLIISSPLHGQLNDLEDQFSEENNAWVKWVATPILCYYQPVDTFKKVRVQLLVPREQTSECAAALPH